MLIIRSKLPTDQTHQLKVAPDPARTDPDCSTPLEQQIQKLQTYLYCYGDRYPHNTPSKIHGFYMAEGSSFQASQSSMGPTHAYHNIWYTSSSASNNSAGQQARKFRVKVRSILMFCIRAPRKSSTDWAMILTCMLQDAAYTRLDQGS
ncbi:hypothetical protein UY3_06862 [Chelonia mydas]|uniref:Uncharacterized protein n=1 Tax=Chelonia mydas TaxID=8469 RepID=M7BFL4_CHEMY|nr:hypothetical protein UY3_06862 [Chelonia mydas]